MKVKTSILLAVFLQLSLISFAQNTTYQVVTKTIEEVSNWQPKQILEINGENAIIHISTWAEDKVHATIELIAKHPDKKVAEADIEVLQYSLTKQRKRIILNNYLSINSKNPKPTSTLKTKFTLRIPVRCPLAIKNNFGSIHIEGIRQQINVDSRFSKVSMEDVKGQLDLNSHFGEFRGTALVGNINITSNRSNLFLNKVAGQVTMDAKYGKIEVVEDATYTYDLTVKGDKADITILNPNTTLNQYALSTSFGNISTPPRSSFETLMDSDTLRQVQALTTTPQSKVTVSLNYGDISLRAER